MRQHQRWLSIGLLALTPGIAMAGALDFPPVKPGAGTAPARPAKKSKAAVNQELAEKIAKAMRKAKLNGYDIEIDVRDGAVTLDGSVNSIEQRRAAAKAAGSVPGVTGINNRLRVAQPVSKPGDEQSAAEPLHSPANPHGVRPANYQAGFRKGSGRQPAIQQAVASDIASAEATGSTAPPGTPVYGPPPAAAGSNAVYNQPNFPNYAWPTYAQYPNYAAVTYPTQYSASAWPYIGPFYPYPQVPLGWRKVTLEWNDGLWNLDFDSLNHRWWWFMDPKNW